MPEKKYQRSLFIFRRDLRLDDNSGLLAALESSRQVIAVFIFDPRQVKTHSYFSAPGFAFMLESLSDLSAALKKMGGCLYFFYGEPEKVLAALLRTQEIQAVFVNRDYTPFSIHRDLALADLCRRQRVVFEEYADALLADPTQVLKPDGGIYTVFSYFFKKAGSFSVRAPQPNRQRNFFSGKLPGADAALLKQFSSPAGSWTIHGGRKEALSLLRDIKKCQNYDAVRDIPSLAATTRLSAHHKFGTCSIRETYHAVLRYGGARHALIRQLYWRDFFTYIGFHCPHVLGSAFHAKYDRLPWQNDKRKFQKWIQGLTGFPIVDAGMRELNHTGFMHNRIRMIAASFLVKDLHIDWRWGEKYFAQKLIDYDPLVNNGNWQWVAATGCDHQPYFRIFNPWRQQERFDPQGLYIKKWIPELKDCPVRLIHNWYAERFGMGRYPLPMVDHHKECLTAKAMFRRR